MLKTPQQTISIFTFAIITTLVACSTIENDSHRIPHTTQNTFIIPEGIATNIEKFSGISFDTITVFDNSQQVINKLRKESVVIEPFKKPEPATEITNVTAISIVDITDTVIGNQKFEQCSIVTIKGDSESTDEGLICKDNRNQTIQVNEKSYEINAREKQLLPVDLVKDITNIKGIKDFAFLVVTDRKTGKTKLLINPDYAKFSTTFDSPLPTRSITSLFSWNVVTYKLNPCRQCEGNGIGDGKCSYNKLSNC